MVRRKDVAYLVEGQHRYSIGWYNRMRPDKAYKALVPSSRGVLVFRDRDNDDVLTQKDRSKGIDSSPNTSIAFNWTGIGAKNWTAGVTAMAGGSYINHHQKVVDCRSFASIGNRDLAEGKTQGAYNVFMDLLTLNNAENIYYTLIKEEDLARFENFPPDFAANLLAKLNPESSSSPS